MPLPRRQITGQYQLQAGQNPYSPSQSWQDLIQQDPRYAQKKATLAGQSAAQAASRAAKARAAFIALGMSPDFSGLPPEYQAWLNQDIDAGTRDLAQQNTSSGLSQAALLQKAHQQNLQKIQDVLAARGMLSSGQTGFETGEENLAAAGRQQAAIEALLSILRGEYGDFAAGEAARAGELGETSEDVLDSLFESGVRPSAGNPLQWYTGGNATPRKPKGRPYY